MRLELLRKYLESPEFDIKISHRIERLQAAEANPVERMTVFMDCKEDPFAFIDLFGVAYEPRLPESPDIPLFLFPHQREIIERVWGAEQRGEDLFIEKTRDMGVTWTVLWYMLWRWRFHEKWYGLVGSRKEEEVDDRCFSDDTEVLTREGWKLFRDVNVVTDEIATRNPLTHEFQWQKVTEKYQKAYNGEFYRIYGRSLDLLVSPNHRVLYRFYPYHGGNSKEFVKSAKELYEMSPKTGKAIPATSVWGGREIMEFTFPVLNNRQRVVTMSGDDFCAFMGMYLSEGCKTRHGFIIYQLPKSKGYQEFRDLMVRIFGVEPPRDGHGWCKTSKPMLRYLSQFGKSPKRFIPQGIMEASPRQLGIFLHYYMLGDGSYSSSLPEIVTTSKRMADQLQEVIQKIGRSTSIGEGKSRQNRFGDKVSLSLPYYRIAIRNTQYQGFHVDKVWYRGTIHCVSAPNSFIYVRRNGKPAWSGNSPQSLFGKLRYAFYALPPWIRPVKFRKSENDLHMKLVNPEMMSYIDGESANPDFARGSRAAFILLDELFFWKWARESWRSCTDASPCRIAVSTSKPSSFARHFKDSFESQKRILTLDWKRHPFKDEQWFKGEEERRKMDPLSVEGELLISYQADPELAYYPEVNLCALRDFDYDPDKLLYVGLDFGAQDKTAIIYFQRDVGYFYCLDGIERRQKPLQWYYPFLKQGFDFEKSDQYEVENKFTKEKFILLRSQYFREELDLIHRFNSWKMPVMYCGEVAHRQKMIKSNTSVAQELAGIGIMLRINDLGIQHSIRRASTKKMLLKTLFSTRYGALDVYDALQNSRFVSGRDNSSSDENKDKPIHDEYADFRSAFENVAVNLPLEGAKIREFVYRKR